MDEQQSHSQENRQNLPCIWMMAGVLNHKICDRQYDCEHCELDKVLRGVTDHPPGASLEDTVRTESRPAHRMGGLVEDRLQEYLSQIVEGSRLYLDRCYSGSHFWIYPDSEDVLVLGLDMNMVKLLYPLDDVVPPEPGTHLRQNQMCALLIRKEMTIPLHVPLKGEVIATNVSFAEALQSGSYETDTWLFKMTPAQPVKNINDLCSGTQMLQGYVRKLNLIKRYLRNALSQSAVSEVGMTMADGGEAQMDLEVVLGAESYKKLIQEIFHNS
ncbi:MAG: hypothetical protein K9N46_12545 [Candidatus Marinimicrobia bacterium]|nr:hypothetical protein [Candidatus Neomarinimicrobiota bacterium]MCF7827579.1 hypothetical protein [Candidatus Neomarinimicrobiota bacterium]MCF7881559.1 hypothetical protein [Candidatus Neomarinimicrobiota bacterium]